ncbi:chorion class CB protein PC404-like [Epargyreus clarus]|uniref:chorion class CB protein PC404-like n=1 Tax=Epargyreus clarus TaxID=520877 RepID=UPI003C2D4C15
MASKIIIVSLVLFVQAISAQVIANGYGPGIIGNGLAAEAALGAYGQALAPNGLPYGPGLPYPANGLAYDAPGCGFGLSLAGLAANGGGFAVTSTSPIAPSGVSVQSENLAFEGPLAVSGQMPFLGAVALEGPLPAAGQGAVAYGCGNGNVGIVSEDLTSVAGPGLGGPLGPNPALAYNGMGPYGPYGPY